MIRNIKRLFRQNNKRSRFLATVAQSGPLMEAIESRTLLSATLVDGLLTIEGTGGDDVIALVAGAVNGQVIVNGPDIDADTVFSGVTGITINALAGNDTVTVGANIKNASNRKINVTINGGDDDDTISGGSGNDLIDGGAGIDTIDYSAATKGVDVRLDLNKAGRDGLGGRDTLSHFENVIGSAFNDSIRGDDNDNGIDAGAGNNTVRGGGGDDSITTHDGNDIIIDTAGINTIDAGGGNNRVTTGAGDDTITTGAGNDTITDKGGTNLINAGDGNNRVSTGDGDDTVTTGSGNDTVTTRGGNDVIDTDGGNDTVTAGKGDDEIHAGAGNDNIKGDDGDDSIDGQEGNDRIDGGRDDDSILGGEDDDSIIGGDGNDDLDGESGNDRIDGGRGDDSILGGEDDDSITGGDGDDDVDGESGDDRIDGGRDDDRLRGGDDDDDLRGGDGDDDVDGEAGDDRVRGGRGRDRIASGSGSDDVADDDRDDDFYADDDVEDDDDHGGQHDEDDDNPTGGPHSTATEVAFDIDGHATLTGTSLNKNDRDIFRFTAATDGSITVESTTTNGNFAKVEIEAAGDDEQSVETEPSHGINTFAMNVTAGTTYFIKIKSPNASPAAYVVNLATSAQILPGGGGEPPAAPADVLEEVEPNGAKATALAFAFPVANVIRLTGTSLNKDDKDYFKFTAAAAGTLTANLYTGEGQSGHVEIESQFGADLLQIEQGDGQHTAAGAVVAGVTYFIRVRSENGVPAEYLLDLAMTV
jgi:Ca2+-binding RTX toxin-like protein